MRNRFQSIQRGSSIVWAGLVAITLFGDPARAFDCYTVADSTDSLISVNELTAAETVRGPTTPATGIEAIAFNPASGILYGANSNQLGTLNQITGAFTATSNTFGNASGSLGNINLNDVDGLTFSFTTGIFYGSHRRSGTDVLFQINPTTGAHVPNAFGANVDYVAITGAEDVDDLAIDPVTDTLYAVVNDGNGANAKLFTVNKTTGATTTVGNLLTSGATAVNDMEGVGIAPDGVLYGTTGESGAGGTNNRLWIINKSTAVVTLVGAFSAGSDYEAFDCNSQSPPTATPTPTLTSTPNPTNTSTSTATATSTSTSTATATNTSTATNTAVNTDTPTATATNTAVNTDTPTATATNTAVNTDTPTATATNTAVNTDTPTATATNTAVDTDTPTATATATAVNTSTFTATATPIPTTCGDGVLDLGELCDDGNLFDGDGCQSNCTISTQCNFSHGGTPSEVFVNDGTGNDGVGAPAGCSSAGFAAIQDAINDAGVGDGDIVSVCPGAYSESVVVSKEVTIRSTGGAAATSLSSAGIAFDVRRSAVTIQGFTIDAATAAVSANSICQIGQASCGTPRGSNLSVRSNTIQNSPIGVAWTPRLDCALVELNTMSANAAHIDIDQQSGAPAVLTRLSQNIISAGGGSGRSVHLSGVGLFTLVVGNTIETSSGNGIVIAALAAGALIEENNIRNNTGSGVVVLAGAAAARVRQNNIEDNGVGLTNQAPEGVVNATLNWWGSQTGPFHATDRPSAVGDEIVESGGGLDTNFIEFLCAPAPGGFPSVNGECGGAEPEEEINFVAFGREPDVSPNGRFITFVSDRDLNRDAVVTVDNSDGGDETFLINRSPGGRPNSFCLGGTTPGANCQRQRDCPANFNADPIVNEGVCVLLTQLSNDPTGAATAAAPRVTRNGNVFFASDANLFGSNADNSLEVHAWSRRGFRKLSPGDPNLVVTMLSNGSAGQDSNRPGSDRGGRRRVFMQSSADPLGMNGDGNTEIMVLDVKRNVWTQITNSSGADNLRPSTQTGRQVLFDSDADLVGQNADGNREVFLAVYKRRTWEITQITNSLVDENHAGSLSKRGKILTFSSNGDPVGLNADGNREIFVWEKGVVEQITQTTVGENANPQANPRGRFVAFESTADVEAGGLGTTLTNRRVHLFDRKNGTTLLLSRSFFGANTAPRISQGRFVVWESTANLTGQNPSGDKAIYLFDRRKDD